MHGNHKGEPALKEPREGENQKTKKIVCVLAGWQHNEWD